MFAEINHFRPYGGSSANWPHCHQQWTACGGHYPGPHPNPPPPKRYILAEKLDWKNASHVMPDNVKSDIKTDFVTCLFELTPTTHTPHLGKKPVKG
ncbi:hypothetical protein M8J76_000022 [Diaphorina citri]|nr:hypothetical protein M8J76_000022 [Diaphorina citri]